MLAAVPTMWVSPRTPTPSSTAINLIDDSWILDTCFKASRGVWFGRDVTFTYGPLYQWLSSAPSRLTGISMGAIYDSCVALPLWCTFFFGYLTLALLLPEQPAWKRFVLLLLLCIFWAPVEGRTAFGVVLFALFLRGWYAVQEHVLSPWLMGGGAALLCALALLYSADTGIGALMGLVISLAGVAWERRREAHMLLLYGSAMLGFAFTSLLLVIVINAIMAGPLEFGFWKNSLAILSGYRWMEPASMSRDGKLRLLIALLAAGILFLVRGFSARKRQLGFTTRSGFLLSAFLFCFFSLQTGLVRSDAPHVARSTHSVAFFAGIVLFSFASRIASAAAIVLAVACSLLFGEQPALPQALRYNYEQVRNPSTECQPGFLNFDMVCYPGEFTHVLQKTAGYLRQRSGPRDAIVIFPYQTLFGVAARRNVAGGVMQSYLASGPYLSQVDIAGLERASPPAGLYLSDNDPGKLIDGVSNFTRSPQVWLWTFRHYHAEQEVSPGIFGLLRDDMRPKQIAPQSEPLNIAGRSYPVPTRTAVVDLGAVAWPAAGADFLRLRITVHYSFWWKVRKPAHLVLEIERADASDDLKPFVVEPNVPSEVWFYPWDDIDLAHYFEADESEWRVGARPAIAHLRLLVMPLDWVSVQPDRIEVQSADAVGFGMRQ